MNVILKVLAVILGFLLFIRIVTGPRNPDGVVVLTGMGYENLESGTFEIVSPTTILIDATGSAELNQSLHPGLAATAWIRNTETGAVVWDMQQEDLQEGRGTLRHVRDRELPIEPGTYGAYFSSYGQHLGSLDREVRRDRHSWKLVIKVSNDGAVRSVVARRPSASSVWEATRLRSRAREEFLFEAVRPITVAVTATGQISADADGDVRDGSWIEDVVSGERVWELSESTTVPAGGLADNRTFHGTVALAPGVYRSVAETDRTHSYGGWRGNPPHDPASWGIAIDTDDPDAIQAFDPWASREALIRFAQVGDHEYRRQRFRVMSPTSVVLWSMGEITGSGDNRYDYATLERELPGRLEEVWSMSWEESVPAGGANKNRQESVFLTLAPGTYALEYQSDGSHAWDSWNSGEPDYPDRWGVSMFAVAERLRSGTFRLLD